MAIALALLGGGCRVSPPLKDTAAPEDSGRAATDSTVSGETASPDDSRDDEDSADSGSDDTGTAPVGWPEDTGRGECGAFIDPWGLTTEEDVQAALDAAQVSREAFAEVTEIVERYAVDGCPTAESDPEDDETTIYRGPCTAADGSIFDGSMAYGYTGAEPLFS